MTNSRGTIPTFCWVLSLCSSLRWNHKVYTTLEYNAIIRTKETPTTTVKIRMKAFIQAFGQVGTHMTLPFFIVVFFARNSGILTIAAKIQLPGIIIWNYKHRTNDSPSKKSLITLVKEHSTKKKKRWKHLPASRVIIITTAFNYRSASVFSCPHCIFATFP